MTQIPAQLWQEGTTASVTGAGQAQLDDRMLRLYWRDCQREGEHLLLSYGRATVNRTYAGQQAALHLFVSSEPKLGPRLRELLAATDQELATLRPERSSDQARAENLVRYRIALDSLWLIVEPILFSIELSHSPRYCSSLSRT